MSKLEEKLIILLLWGKSWSDFNIKKTNRLTKPDQLQSFDFFFAFSSIFEVMYIDITLMGSKVENNVLENPLITTSMKVLQNV